jgi:lipid A 3-O-deacylase PagL
LRTAALAAGLGAFLLSASPARAEGPLEPGRPPEWGIAAGYGIPAHLGPGDSDEHQVVLSPSVGFRLSSRLEWLAGATFERYVSPDAYFVGILPGGLRYTFLRGPWLPYAALGLGVGWTDLVHQIPEINRRFNFRIEGAAGVRREVTETSGWTFEVRYQHTSNAGTVPPNYGLNSFAFLGGWRFR